MFISFGGFTAEGLHAFGRGKRVIGVEGRDLREALERGIGIDRLLAAKVRHAAETGAVFVPMADLSLWEGRDAPVLAAPFISGIIASCPTALRQRDP